MPELNHAQFSGTTHGISPNQLAIPGMEEHAHPFATHLARGYQLDLERSEHEHHLAAVDVSHPKYPSVHAELSWAKENDPGHVPGEVTMVENMATQSYTGAKQPEEIQRARGLGGALFHSAHYWNFGQSTVPIHSPERTQAGEHFASKVRPDLKPDVWHVSRGVSGTEAGPRGEREIRAPGKPDWAPAEWPGVPEDFHPFEQQRTAIRQAAAAKSDEAVAMHREGHQQLFKTDKYRAKKKR